MLTNKGRSPVYSRFVQTFACNAVTGALFRRSATTAVSKPPLQRANHLRPHAIYTRNANFLMFAKGIITTCIFKNLNFFATF